MYDNSEDWVFDVPPGDSTLLSVGAWADDPTFPDLDLLPSITETLALPHTEKLGRGVERWLHITTLFDGRCGHQLEQTASSDGDHVELASASDSGQEPDAGPWTATMPFKGSLRAKVRHPWLTDIFLDPNCC